MEKPQPTKAPKCGCKFAQPLVDQRPRYDSYISRGKHKILTPKKKPRPHFL